MWKIFLRNEVKNLSLLGKNNRFFSRSEESRKGARLNILFVYVTSSREATQSALSSHLFLTRNNQNQKLNTVSFILNKNILNKFHMINNKFIEKFQSYFKLNNINFSANVLFSIPRKFYIRALFMILTVLCNKILLSLLPEQRSVTGEGIIFSLKLQQQFEGTGKVCIGSKDSHEEVPILYNTCPLLQSYLNSLSLTPIETLKEINNAQLTLLHELVIFSHNAL